MKTIKALNFMKYLSVSGMYSAVLNLLSLSSATAYGSEYDMNIDENETIEFIDKNIVQGQEIISQHEMREEAVVFAGNTRVGKGTSVNYAAGIPLKMTSDGEGGFVIEKKNSNDNPSVTISHEYGSDTFFPGIVLPEGKDYSYMDFAGFEENRGVKHEIVNAFFRKKIIDSYKAIKVVLVLEQSEIEVGGQNKFLDAIRGISDLLGINNQTNIDDIKDSVGLLITKAKFHDTPIDAVKKKLEKLINVRGDKLTDAELKLIKHIISENNIAIFSKADSAGDLPLEERDKILELIDDKLTYLPKEDIHVQARISDIHTTKVEGVVDDIFEKLKPVGKEILVNINKALNSKITDLSAIDSLQKAIKDLADTTVSLKEFIDKLGKIIELDSTLVKNILHIDERLEFLTSLFPTVIGHEHSRKYENNWAGKLGIQNELETLATDCTKGVSSKSNGDKRIIDGAFVRVSDIVKELKGVTVSKLEVRASSTLVIDEDLNLSGADVSIIAPNWQVIGKRTINLNGKDGVAHTPAKAANGVGHIGKDGKPGEDGKPGNHGGNAGNFYGYGNYFSGIEGLTISAIGGKGGKGQDGGNGTNGVSFENEKILKGLKKRVKHEDKGGSGGDGGKAGHGGYGGYKGLIKFFGLGNKEEINSIANNGSIGEKGKAGEGGEGGKSQWGFRNDQWNSDKGSYREPNGNTPNELNDKGMVPPPIPNLKEFEEFLSKTRENYLDNQPDLYKLVNAMFYENLCKLSTKCLVEFQAINIKVLQDITNKLAEKLNKIKQSPKDSRSHDVLAKEIEGIQKHLLYIDKLVNQIDFISQSTTDKVKMLFTEAVNVMTREKITSDNIRSLNLKLQNIETSINIEQLINKKQKLLKGLDCNEKIILLQDIANIYLDFKDKGKALEFLSKAYSIASNELGPFDDKTLEIANLINNHDKDFFCNSLFRSFISGISLESELTIAVKIKIQETVLNEIAKLAAKGNWYSKGLLSSSGVKTYLEDDYLLEKLGNSANDDKINIARKLIFEAINLGTMHSKNKDFTCVEEFVKSYPDVVLEVAKENPDYFIDCYIVHKVGLHINDPVLKALITNEDIDFVKGLYETDVPDLDIKHSIEQHSFYSGFDEINNELHCMIFNFNTQHLSGNCPLIHDEL